jgi:hypothetical protein
VYTVSPVSLDCPFKIALSVFSDVYLYQLWWGPTTLVISKWCIFSMDSVYDIHWLCNRLIHTIFLYFSWWQNYFQRKLAFSNVHFVHFASDLYLKIYSYFCTLYLSFNCLGYQLFISLIVSYNIFSSTCRRHALLYLYPASVINTCAF